MNPKITEEQRKAAIAIIEDFNVLTAGEGEYADNGIYANRFQDDVRRSDVNAWLIERIASLLASREAQAAHDAARKILNAIEAEATNPVSQMSNEGHMLAAARDAAEPYLKRE